MGCGDPNLNLGPPLVKLLGRPIVGLRGRDNFLRRKGTCRANIGLVGEELGKGLSEVLLVLDECNGSVFFFLSNLRLDHVLSYHTKYLICTSYPTVV